MYIMFRTLFSQFCFLNLQVFEQQDAVEYYRKILKAVGTHASKVWNKSFNASKKQLIVNKSVITDQ